MVFIYANNLGWDAAETFTPIGTKTGVFDTLNPMIEAISVMAQPNDHIVVMSNGGFGGVHGKLLHQLAMRSMQK
jgi:UDP-N-acetylmuramate: L-alanyl-gamma-D-glutamyl-meso-diaminopimelate ligase